MSPPVRGVLGDLNDCPVVVRLGHLRALESVAESARTLLEVEELGYNGFARSELQRQLDRLPKPKVSKKE